jgi:hypothetical protein
MNSPIIRYPEVSTGPTTMFNVLSDATASTYTLCGTVGVLPDGIANSTAVRTAIHRAGVAKFAAGKSTGRRGETTGISGNHFERAADAESAHGHGFAESNPGAGGPGQQSYDGTEQRDGGGTTTGTRATGGKRHLFGQCAGVAGGICRRQRGRSTTTAAATAGAQLFAERRFA